MVSEKTEKTKKSPELVYICLIYSAGYWAL